MPEILLGAGSNHAKKLGFSPEWNGLVTVDINPDHKPDVLHDLSVLPLPFADDCADEIHAYDVMEHVGAQGDWRFFFDQWSDIWRVLKPGGKLLVLEFSRVTPALAPAYDWYSFNILPKMGQLVAGDEASYRYLAESIRMHPDQETLAGMMREAGLDRVRYFNMTAGVVALHEGVRLD